MEATIINGCDKDSDFIKATVTACQTNLNSVNINDVWFNLCKIQPKPCIGGDICQIKNPGICTIDDGVNGILKQYINSDIVIIITPVMFGCSNSITKNFIDRTQPLFLPYQVIHKHKSSMKKRYSKYPNVLVIGIAEKCSDECIETFKQSIENSSLLSASDIISVKVLTGDSDLSNLKDWIKNSIAEGEKR